MESISAFTQFDFDLNKNSKLSDYGFTSIRFHKLILAKDLLFRIYFL